MPVNHRLVLIVKLTNLRVLPRAGEDLLMHITRLCIVVDGRLTQQLLLYGERLLSLRDRILELWYQLTEPRPLYYQLLITRGVKMAAVFSPSL